MIQHDAMALLKSTHRSKKRDELAKKICGDTSKWVMTAPLWEVVLRIWAVYRYDSSLLDVHSYVGLTKRLVEAENAPGGPYHEQNTSTNVLNLLVLRLFREFKKPLKNVEDFVSVHRETFDTGDPLVAFLVTFPEKLSIISEKSHTAPISPDDLAVYTQGLNGLLRKDAETYVAQILRLDAKRGEISVLSRYASEVLGIRKDSRVLGQLADANICLWVAYTLYDHVIDGETDVRDVSIANHYHRHSYKNFLQVARGMSKATVVDNYFLGMDAANRWELEYTRAVVRGEEIDIPRLPNYKDRHILAERAGGRILGPLLLSYRTPRLTDSMRRNYEKGLQHYLIARQLSDDLHDWVDDLMNGQLSFVVTHLLALEKVQPSTYDKKTLIKKLQKAFWNKGFEQLASIASNHIDTSIRLLRDIEVSEGAADHFLHTTIIPIQDSLREGLRTYRQQKSFVGVYRQS